MHMHPTYEHSNLIDLFHLHHLLQCSYCCATEIVLTMLCWPCCVNHAVLC